MNETILMKHKMLEKRCKETHLTMYRIFVSTQIEFKM